MTEPGYPRVCVVTGANTGIGRVTALEVARTGARVILACRSEARTVPVIHEIIKQTGNENVEFAALDLADFASVNACADGLLALDIPIDLLINNAGVAGLRRRTADGFELAFGVNHLGHYLLTLRLLGRISESAPARIVNVASRAHRDARALDLDRARGRTSFTGLAEYAASKLANILFSRSLARRLEGTGVNSYVLHPGVVASDIWERRIPTPAARLMQLFMLSVEDGAKTTLHCALSEEAGSENGLYYNKSRPEAPAALARDDELGEKLWRRSADWTGVDWPG